MQLTRRLDLNHDMTFGAGLANFAVNAEATAQNVRTRLQTIQGEWFLDTGAGVPYLDNDYVTKAITDKPADTAFADAVIQAEVLDTDGVDVITSYSSNFNRATRAFSVAITLADIWGNTVNIEVVYE
jgi:hypothetical protein